MIAIRFTQKYVDRRTICQHWVDIFFSFHVNWHLKRFLILCMLRNGFLPVHIRKKLITVFFLTL